MVKSVIKIGIRPSGKRVRKEQWSTRDGAWLDGQGRDDD